MTEERVRVPRGLAIAAAWSWRLLVIAGAVVVIALALAHLRLVFLPLVVGLFVATLLVPPAKWLRDRGWPSLLATWVVFLAALAVLAGVGFFLGVRVAAEFGDLGQGIGRAVERVQRWLVEDLGVSERQIDQLIAQAGERLRQGAGGIVRGAVAVGEAIAGALLALVVTFFFVKDGERMATWARERLSPAHRDDASEMARRAWNTLAAFIRGTALIGLVEAAVTGIGLLVLGVPLVLPLAVLFFFAPFFPIIGAFAAGVIATLVALVSGGAVDALLVAALVIVVQQVEGDVLAPVILGRAVKLHPLVVLLALTAGAVIWGIAGAFLAVPLAGVAVVVGGYLRERGHRDQG